MGKLVKGMVKAFVNKLMEILMSCIKGDWIVVESIVAISAYVGVHQGIPILKHRVGGIDFIVSCLLFILTRFLRLRYFGYNEDQRRQVHPELGSTINNRNGGDINVMKETVVIDVMKDDISIDVPDSSLCKEDESSRKNAICTSIEENIKSNEQALKIK
ncbi:Uncharacterized protein Adt_09773 [Abeliophyllum distichum]|uniref:Uncharacterized protein n=1 Tax=Abeliophyllum distichum TaxID=126358 RepID=A0ABD1UI49_9LAMI